VPLPSAVDAQGRARGWAAGLPTHFAEYKGSNWRLFGSSSPAFYESGVFANTLRSMLVKMKTGELEASAAEDHRKRLATGIKPTAPAPAGFLRLSEDRKHILYPDGRRFFMIGVNYHRPLHTGEWYRTTDDFDDLALEDDFRKARDAGVNCIRLGPSSRFYSDPELVKECARKYGIYLLIILNRGTRRDFVENAEKAARMDGDEPMALGYDIQDEPAADAPADLTFDAAKIPVLKLRPYERYAGKLDKPAGPASTGRGGRDPEDARNLAAFAALRSRATEHSTRGAASTFPGLTARFSVAGEWRELHAAMNDTPGRWIKRHIEAIRKYDRRHPISAGYNNILECLPANRQLDFVSHHVYDRPSSYEQVMSKVATVDRIARVWPDRPITFGESGYSNGIVMPDGRYLDFHTAAVGEMLHYLYALAQGYDGAMKRVLTDGHRDPIAKAGERGRATQIYEAYFGRYYYDGNPRGLGRPKPVCHSMKFPRDYRDENRPGGTIDIARAGLDRGRVCLQVRQGAVRGRIRLPIAGDRIPFRATGQRDGGVEQGRDQDHVRWRCHAKHRAGAFASKAGEGNRQDRGQRRQSDETIRQVEYSVARRGDDSHPVRDHDRK
jgi:hypothetical protein